MTSEQGPPPGWYPHPDMENTQRYWDGEKFTDNAPAPRQPQSSGGVSPQVIGVGLVAVTVVGLILSQQSVSLLTGSGIVWTGAAICVGTAIVALFVKIVPTWTTWVCVIAAAIAIASGIYIEQQLNDRREDLSNIGSLVDR